jgi:mannose-6-phosphate isomerase-like protein (cupin superfamily)
VPAVFVEVNAIHFDTVYPATGPAPEALPGRVVNYGFADPNDPANPNRSAAPARGAGPAPAPAASPRDFAPNVPAGHLHPGSSEWWIVLVGQISAKFESGSYIGTEGDILYAPPYMSHAMANYGPGGSCRIAIGWYDQEHFDPPVE